jgi:exosortase family protein XrtF
MKLKDFIKKNFKAIRFLLLFSGLYLVLNTIYGYFVANYYPTSDPFTRRVAEQIVGLLSWFDPVAAFPSSFNEYIAIANKDDNIVYFYEGYNGLVVMIVYVSFLVAFTGPIRLFLKFALMGLIGIHFLNIFRVAMLYVVSTRIPTRIDFFYTYLFGSIIYVVVFIFWVYWIRAVKNGQD